MPVAVVEPCPPELAHLERPEYGGSLFFNLEEGTAGCQHCGWSGIPTVNTVGKRLRVRQLFGQRPLCSDAVISTWCPACQHELDTPAVTQASRRVPRNHPCPCGSGVKAKRCGCPEYTV